MALSTNHQERLAQLLSELAPQEGMQTTSLDGVRLFRRSEPLERRPMIYHPNILIVGQGQKQAYVGSEVYTYNPFNYLVLSVPMPAECEAPVATPEKPILILSLDVDATMIGELILEIDDADSRKIPHQTPRGMSTSPMTDEMGQAVIRLLESLRSPLDSRILGRQIMREIIFRVLCGEQGGALRALANRDEHFTGIARVMKLIHTEYERSISTDEMARHAGMGASGFHHHFRMVTASSPVQYLKRVRLDRARLLMAHEGYNSSTAARAVGYESTSQFCREFKRLFGMTPVEDAQQVKSKLTV